MAKKTTKAETKVVVKKDDKQLDFTKMTEKELQENLAQMRKDLGDFRRSLVAGELVNPQVITSTRKQIARVLTQLNVNKSATSTKKEDA
ncbi:50S ribosomal protein L29 [Candidatus Saccharibacteria bacterium 32-45-3]|nr:MAG: 50S ribosomal protein L29 [Candidatus Saccharibacteria bacterium 32-45-3]